MLVQESHVSTLTANTIAMHFPLISFLLIVLCANCLFQNNNNNNHLKCNFEEFKKGCADEEGSLCDNKTQKCVCRPGFTIRLGVFCLQPKFIGDECFASVQCNHTPNAGCYNYRQEYNQIPSDFFGNFQENWPSGTCRCQMGHHYETHTKTCIKKTIGSWCQNLWDCRQSDPQINAICEENECKCSHDHFYNSTTQDCHYRETYGLSCIKQEDCLHPALCLNGTCICENGFHFEAEKSPLCQPDNNANEMKVEETLNISKGDKSFQIFVLSAIPFIIIFLTIKPCLIKLGKCKATPDEIICGSKEIRIKSASIKQDLALHHFTNSQLQTIEEDGEELKEKEEMFVDGDEEPTKEPTKKSISKMPPMPVMPTMSVMPVMPMMPTENKLEDVKESLECAPSSTHTSLSSNCIDSPVKEC